MTLFLIAGLLAAGVVLALIRPLLRAEDRAAPAAAFNAAVYRDQLTELDRDLARGVLNKAEAEAARAEIGRRLLAETRAGEGGAATRGARVLRIAIIAAAVALPLAAGALYLQTGAPDLPDQPLAERAKARQAAEAADPARTEMKTLVAKLAGKLEQRPDDAEGWTLLARSYVSLERYADAAAAFQRAMDITGGSDSALLGEYAEARVLANGGVMDIEALSTFQDILAENPKDPQARFYVGLGKAQSGDAAGALADWKALLADSPADAPWVPALRGQIARLDPEAAKAPAAPASGPSADDIAAAKAMTPEARQAMIDGMVARLAAKMEANPGDINGWRRLADAYSALGRTEDATNALQRILALAPDDADALWALGVQAQAAGDSEGARKYWTRLAAALPEGSREREKVEAALSALPAE